MNEHHIEIFLVRIQRLEHFNAVKKSAMRDTTKKQGMGRRSPDLLEQTEGATEAQWHSVRRKKKQEKKKKHTHLKHWLTIICSKILKKSNFIQKKIDEWEYLQCEYIIPKQIIKIAV